MPVQSTAMGPHAICTVRQPMDTRFSTTDGRSISPLLPLAPAAANTESTTRVENKCVMCWSNTTKSAAPCTPAITDTKFCRTTSSLAMRSRAQPSDSNPGKFSPAAASANCDDTPPPLPPLPPLLFSMRRAASSGLVLSSSP